MATRSFLNADEITLARERWGHLHPSSIRKNFSEPAVGEMSHWLGEKLLGKLKALPHWGDAGGIALGSWSRGELCPRSDIDVLFTGPEDKVRALVTAAEADGLTLRYRVPENPEDWTVGVEDFDTLALLRARGLTGPSEAALVQAQARFRPKINKWRRKLMASMRRERHDRTRRYDSLANYLEPNLKFGPGGLRDLEQGLTCEFLFPDLFKEHRQVIRRLNEFKQFFLMIRQRLHLNGYQDTLVSQAQMELAAAFGFLTVRDFMSDVQLALSEVSFYSDWMFEWSTATAKKRAAQPADDSLASVLKALKENPSTILQEKVRRADLRVPHRKQVGKTLSRFFNSDADEKFVESLFRSKVLHRLIPELRRVEGLVQHDQYHRLAVDAHTLQAVRQVLRLKKKPGFMGRRLGALAKSLRPPDWEVLLWTALYHDLAKGRQGDHSTEGAEVAKRDLTSMGISLRQTVEVAWMVQNHLLISGAAFRMNPREPRTWETLFDRGVRGDRLRRLSVFTALDIYATNPEAWNSWKEQLIEDLVRSVESPQGSRFFDVLESAQKKGLKLDRQFIEGLDPRVLQAVPFKTLMLDVKRIAKEKKSLEPLVFKRGKTECWVRFHEVRDQEGLFLRYVRALHQTGANVIEAYVQTFAAQGVYDWFHIRSSREAKVLKRLLIKFAAAGDIQAGAMATTNPSLGVKFDVIEVIDAQAEQAILSFRGRDQRGALMAAASKLYEAGMPIIWAKVNTWGRQIDDVFCVRATPEKARKLSL